MIRYFSIIDIIYENLVKKKMIDGEWLDAAIEKITIVRGHLKLF